MKITPMTSRTGHAVANQNIITDDHGEEYFQSYKTVIAHRALDSQITLDPKYNISKTTSKSLYQFLGVSGAEFAKRLKSGEYKVANLNGK